MARIIVAEDESVAAWYLQEALENLGHTVLASVASGADAIQHTAELSPDLVLMDIRLEGNIDGVVAAEQIRDRFDVPVIYITAHADEATWQRAMQSQPFGYIIKPFQERELQTAIAIALQRYQLEKRLRETKQRLATTLASIGDGAIATDSDGNITFINPVAEDITGWRQPEVLGQGSSRVLDLINAETGEAIENPLLRAIQEGVRVNLPDRCLLRTKDGTAKPIGDSAAPIRNSNGVVTGGILVFQDISDRVEAQDALRQQAERERLLRATAQRIRQSLNLEEILSTTVAEIRQLLQVDRVLIYHIDANRVGQVIVESSAAEQARTLLASVGNRTFSDLYNVFTQGQALITPDIEQDPRLTEDLDLLRRLGVKSQLVVPILQPNTLWGLLIVHECHRVRDWQHTEVDLLQQLAVQVSIALQQAQLYQQVQRLNADLERQMQDRTAKLQVAYEFEATLKRITDSVRDSLNEDQILQTVVRELALATGVGCCNAALFDLRQGISTIRYEYATFLAPMQGQVSRMAGSQNLYQQILRGQSFQFCSLTPNPLRGRVATLVSPIMDAEGVIGDLWLSDYSDRTFTDQDIRLVEQVANQCAIAIRQAQLYQAAQSQVRELERLSRLKDDFLSTISHELRTPLSNILMAVQMLEIVAEQEGAITLNQGRAARYFNILRDECQREIKLVDDLLGFPRLDAGQEPLSLTAIHLQEWIPHVVELYQERAHSRQQLLHVTIAPDVPPLVTDVSLLSHILSELLNNACTYTPLGEFITVSAFATDEAVNIQVSNTGIEIPERELPLIFDKFYRIPSNDPWRYTGLGLGLALVKKRTEYLGATIDATSANGITRFTLRFPRQVVQAEGN